MQMQAGFMVTSGNNQLNHAAFDSNAGADLFGGFVHLGSNNAGASHFGEYMAGVQPGAGGMAGDPNMGFNPFAAPIPQSSMGQGYPSPGPMANINMNNGGIHMQNYMENPNPNAQFNPFAAPQQVYEQQPLNNPYQAQGGFSNPNQVALPEGFAHGQMGGDPNQWNQGYMGGGDPNQWNQGQMNGGSMPAMNNWYDPNQGGNPYGQEGNQWNLQSQEQNPQVFEAPKKKKSARGKNN
jgi:hypothetical protein